MIRPPSDMGAFHFVAIAALRVAQLARGCRPRVIGDHANAVIALREIAEGKVTSIESGPPDHRKHTSEEGL